MLSESQELALTSGGDCFEHFHSTQIVTHETTTRAISAESSAIVAIGTSILRPGIDYVIADTAAGNATVILPDPNLKLAVTIIKINGANIVTVDSPIGTINGAATYALTTAYQTAKFKAIDGNYYVVA